MAIAATMCLSSLPLGAQEAATIQQYSIPGHGTFVLRVPKDWRSASKPLQTPPSVALRFAPPSGNAFNLQVTSVWVEPEKLAALTPARIKSVVEGTAADMLRDAVEKVATLVELRGPQSIGYHVSLTDRRTPASADDYKYITHGTVRTGEVVSIFTLLYGDAALPAREQILRMLADATYSAGSSPVAAPDADTDALRVRESEQGYELSVPTSRLVMTIPRGGLTRATNPHRGAAASPRYFMFEDAANAIFVSGWFEPERKFSGIKAFWETEATSMRRLGVPAPREVSFTRTGTWDVVVYDQHPIPNVTSSHMRAHWVQAGTWIDVHISVTSDRSSAENRAKLTALLETIRVEKRE